MKRKVKLFCTRHFKRKKNNKKTRFILTYISKQKLSLSQIISGRQSAVCESQPSAFLRDFYSRRTPSACFGCSYSRAKKKWSDWKRKQKKVFSLHVRVETFFRRLLDWFSWEEDFFVCFHIWNNFALIQVIFYSVAESFLSLQRAVELFFEEAIFFRIYKIDKSYDLDQWLIWLNDKIDEWRVTFSMG